MAFRSLFTPAVRTEMRERLDRLLPGTRPRWGKLDAPRLLCHLADSLRISLGEIDAGPHQPGFMSSRLGRWLVIDGPMPWPKGIAVPEAFFSTPVEPSQFERDRMVLHDLIERFARGSSAETRWGVSPNFGALSPDQWARLNARHLDHHFRQFGC